MAAEDVITILIRLASLIVEVLKLWHDYHNSRSGPKHVHSYNLTRLPSWPRSEALPMHYEPPALPGITHVPNYERRQF